MDQNTPRGDVTTKPLKPARVALNVLALCFTLSVLGRGLSDSFTVFLKPISENFGWDRAQVVSVYSLTWVAGGLTAPLVGRLFDLAGPRTVYALGLALLGGAFLAASHAQALWQLQLSIGLAVGLGIALIDGPYVLGWETWHEIEARHGLGLIEAGLTAARDAGQIRDVPVPELALMLLGAVIEAALRLARASDVEGAKRRTGEALRALIEGLRVPSA